MIMMQQAAILYQFPTDIRDFDIFSEANMLDYKGRNCKNFLLKVAF